MLNACYSKKSTRRDGDSQAPPVKPSSFAKSAAGRQEAQETRTGGDCTAGVHAEEGGICFGVRVGRRRGDVVSAK